MSNPDDRAMQQAFDTGLMQARGMAGGSYGNALGLAQGLGQGLVGEAYGCTSSIGVLNTTSTDVFGVSTPASRIEDVVLFRNEPIPEEWRGAKIDGFVRVWHSKLWGIAFKSNWSSERLMLYLNADKFSGEQADAIAATHMEALNQRRVG